MEWMSAISVFQVKFNVEFTCQAVNFLESHSQSHLSKAKRSLFHFVNRASAQTKETLSKSMSMCFHVLFEYEWFPQIF